MTTPTKALPNVNEPTTAPFWEGARNHVLMAQKCNNCAAVRYPALEICPKCWSDDQEWTEIAPTGELYSYVVYHRALDPSMKGEIPYAIGRVVTDDDVIYTVRLDIPIEDIAVGQKVTANWNDVTDEVSLLQFTTV